MPTRTVDEIRADLAKATSDEQRNTLISELEQALTRPDKPSELEQLRARVSDADTQRAKLVDEFEQVTTGAIDDDGNARDFTPEESEQRGRLQAQIDQAHARHTELQDQLRQRERDERQKDMDEKVAQMRRDLGLGDTPANAQGGGIEAVNEHRTYERGNGVSYLKDLVFASYGAGVGPEYFRAVERLNKHGRENHFEALAIESKSKRSAQEEYFLRQMIECRNPREAQQGAINRRGLSYRALSTTATAGGEFAPPLYLTSEWVEYLRAGRVVANCMHHEDLPDGTMSINVPKVVSGVTYGVQAVQNTNVPMTDITTEFVTAPVFTAAGAEVISLQLLERSAIQFDEIVWKDLAKAQAQTMDYLVINGSGLNSEPTGILNTAGITTVTWTQASPTVKGLYGQIGVVKEKIANAIFVPATHQFLTPNAWEWIAQTFDNSNRPLVVPEYAGPFNAVAVPDTEATAEGVVGSRMSGLNTFEDANIPQNLGTGKKQDVDIICRGDENYLYEAPVVTRALPQTYGAQLSVLLQAYNYAAFTAARYPKANAVLTGTGMSQENRSFNS